MSHSTYDHEFITSSIRLEKRYEHYNSDLSEISSADETNDDCSSEENSASEKSNDIRMPSSDGEIEIDECIFTISEELPETPTKIKTKKEKSEKSPKHPIPPKLRKCSLNKNPKSKKFRIKAIETKLVSFQVNNYFVFLFLPAKTTFNFFLEIGRIPSNQSPSISCLEIT